MWTVLRTFESEPEARVVEAFLKANEIDVQLLGVHSHPGPVAPGSLKTASLRMMVRDEQVSAAENLLKETESRAHLSLADEHSGSPPKIDWRMDRVIVILLIVVAALIGLISFRR